MSEKYNFYLFNTMMSLDPEEHCISLINFCLLPPLDGHVNKNLYKRCIDQYFEELLAILKNKTFNPTPLIVSSLFILFKELNSKGPWTIEVSKPCSIKLNQTFKEVCNESLENIFLSQSYNKKQDVFDTCMITLHHNLTAENFKKFPAQIFVYIYLIFNSKIFQVDVNAQKVLPVALVLSDDSRKEFKLKGLQCCAEILDVGNGDIFKGGNYYEVIFRSLKKNIIEKDVEVTNTALACFHQFSKAVPPLIQNGKCHDLLHVILNELHKESNLSRKSNLFNKAKEIIKLLGIDSGKHKKKYMMIMTDTLEICLSEGVAEILLPNTLQCLQDWITQCWCLWKLSLDHKVLSTLVKILLVIQNEKFLEQIVMVITTLVFLCSDKEQNKIAKDLADTTAMLMGSNIQLERLENLRNHLNI